MGLRAAPDLLAAVATLVFVPAASFVLGAPTLAAQSETTADRRLLDAIDLYTGVAGRTDNDRAHDLLSQVADNDDDALATMWIARVYSRGRMGFEHDEDRAREIASRVISAVRDLAAGGDVEAAFLMGTAYGEGLGVDIDPSEAVRWYRRAAVRGHVLAEHNLGNAYREGRGVDVDHVSAARWWLRAAHAGDSTTQLRLGEAFEAGQGVTKSIDQAAYWYGQAAARGDTAAAEALRRLRPPLD